MTDSRAKPTASAVPHPYWIDGINDPKDASRLVKRVKLSDLMNYDPRASYRHRRLWDFHLGWAHKDYNWTSLASVRRIHAEMQARSPTRTALSIQNIASGDRDLVEWKYLFEDEKGSGRRGSRFSINWQLLELAANGKFPLSVHPVDDANSVHHVDDTTVHPVDDATTVSVHPVDDEDPNTRPGLQDPGTCSDIDIPQASPAAEGGELAGGFDVLAAAYAKPGDNLPKARLAFRQINPDEAELARIVKAAESWRASAKGPRMSLERWVKERRWLSTEEFKQDNRPPTCRYPSCVVTWIRPVAGGGARVKYRDENGGPQMQQLDTDELDSLKSACASDRPACDTPSEDLHELVGAHFWIDVDGCFEPYRSREAA